MAETPNIALLGKYLRLKSSNAPSTGNHVSLKRNKITASVKT
jgi:hypothetical protein